MSVLESVVLFDLVVLEIRIFLWDFIVSLRKVGYFFFCLRVIRFVFVDDVCLCVILVCLNSLFVFSFLSLKVWVDGLWIVMEYRLRL